VGLATTFKQAAHGESLWLPSAVHATSLCGVVELEWHI
jgi:hypothetical protein